MPSRPMSSARLRAFAFICIATEEKRSSINKCETAVLKEHRASESYIGTRYSAQVRENWKTSQDAITADTTERLHVENAAKDCRLCHNDILSIRHESNINFRPANNGTRHLLPIVAYRVPQRLHVVTHYGTVCTITIYFRQTEPLETRTTRTRRLLTLYWQL